MAYKVDMKDRRILRELDKDPDITISRLAKKVGVSQQVADYRLKNLLKHKVITGIIAFVDMGKLGYTLYRIHIRFKTISKEKKHEFEKEIFNNYKCFFIGALGGRWDYYLDIFARTPVEFEEKLTEIANKFREEVQEYETYTILRSNTFNYKYILDGIEPGGFHFLEASKEHAIDGTDSNILMIIKENSRTPYLKIASKVGLSRNAVKERIKRLHQRGIIAANRIFLNPCLMGRETYKILLKLKNDYTERQRLIKFARLNENIIYALELIGEYQLDLEIEVEDREKLQELLIQVRNNFSIIDDYEVFPLFYDYGIDFYPINKK